MAVGGANSSPLHFGGILADLISLAQAKQYLQIPTATTGDDAMIQSFIDGASAEFLTYTSLPYILQTSFTEQRNGPGGASITLRNRPVLTVTSLVINNVTVASSPDGVQAGYILDTAVNAIHLVGGYTAQSLPFLAIGYVGYPGRFVRGFGNVFITGTAGYATVPFDIQKCVYEMVGWAYKSRDRIGKGSVHFADSLTETYRTTPFSDASKLTIAKYTRKDPIW